MNTSLSKLTVSLTTALISVSLIASCAHQNINTSALAEQESDIETVVVNLDDRSLTQAANEERSAIGDAVSESNDSTVQDNTRSFSADTLFALLIAEIAAYRNRVDVTLGNYVQQAHATKDPAVIERAIEIASYMNAKQSTLDLATLWQTVEPNNPRAHAVAADQLTHFNRRLLAIDAADKVLSLDEAYNFEPFIHALETAPLEDYPALTAQLVSLAEKHPDNAQIWLALSRIHQLSGHQKEALQGSKTAINLDEGYVPAAIMHAQQLTTYLDDKNKALKFLTQAIKRFPQEKRLHIVYVQALIAQHKKTEARTHMDFVTTSFPYDKDLKLSLSLLAWENEMDDIAKDYLVQLLNQHHRTEEVNYYLGRIAASEENHVIAIQHFENINPGPNYLAARLHIALMQSATGELKLARKTLIDARQKQPQDGATFYNAESELLIEQGQFKEAFVILNHALREYPSSTRLLYSRAMIAEKLEKLDILEQDLTKIIELDPENAVALNALGYTLTDRTDRHKEALSYITKAFEISPKDPAVVDSLGWVYYRMGNHQEAIKYLRNANDMQADHEIAAHLGEVLWVAGQKEEAVKVWTNAKKNAKDSSVLEAVMHKFIK